MPVPRRFTMLAAVALTACAAAAAHAGPSVTIYSGNLAYVRETRGFDLAGGRDTLQLAGLPEGVDVSSIRFEPGNGLAVAGLAWNGDLASGERMLEQALGRRISVGLENDHWRQGTLLAVDGAWLLLGTDDGTMNIARSEVHEIGFLEAPAPGPARPLLEVALEGAKRGRGTGELSYLTGGFSWGAVHTLIRRGATGGEWSAAVTVSNQTDVAFTDATLKLVAGTPSRVNAPGPRPYMAKMSGEMMAASAAPDLVEQSFSEYHLYSLPRPATLRAHGTQQLTMIEPRDVRLTPRYVTSGGGPVMAKLELVNSKAGGPGVPLAGGIVRIFEPDPSGALQFTGEARIGHTPVDEKLMLDVGQAFDLVAERRELAQRRISDREREYDVELKLRNRRKEGVTIRADEPMRGDYDILKKSQPFQVVDARTIRFEVQVPAGKEVTVTYTARIRS